MGSRKQKTREKIAKILGEKDVQVLDNYWLKKMQEGVIVTLHIGRWRARAKLTYGDLGFPEADKSEEKVLDDLLMLGDKFLLPMEYVRGMESTESAARKYLTKVAYATAYGPFVPFTKYQEVRTELDKHRDKFLALGYEIANNIDEITEKHLVTCREAARKAYERLVRLTPRFKTSANYKTEDEFIDRFLDSITADIPTQEHLLASYVFDINVAFIPLPSLIERDMAEAARVRAETDADEERIRAEGRVDAAKIRAEEERIRAARDLERVQEEKALSIEEAALRDRQQKLEAMNRAVLEDARRKKQDMIDGFMKDLLVQLRGLVYETATDVLAGIEKNKVIHPKSIEQLRNMIKQVGELNFFGDADIDQMIGSVMSSLGNLGKERNAGEIQECLRNVATLTRSSLVDLGETPRSAHALGVPDVPVETDLRKSRESLGLADLEGVAELGERTGRRL